MEFGIEHLVSHGRFDGWYPRAYLGHHNFGIRGPGVTWLTALVQAASLGRLPTSAAFNIVVLGSVALLPISVAFAARGLGLDRTTAGIAGILALAVSNPVGNGIEGLFGLGVIENTVATNPVFLALGTLVRAVREPRPRWIVLGAAAVAATALTHTPTMIVFVPLAAIYLLYVVVTAEHPLRAVARLALVGVAAAGLAAFWLVPLVAHRDLAGISAPTPPGRTFRGALEGLATGQFLLPGRLSAFVLAGFAFALFQAVRGDRLALLLVLGPVTYFLVAYLLAAVLPFQIGWQAQTRGLGYAAILATLPLASLLATLGRPLGVVGRLGAVAGGVALVVLSAGKLRSQHVQPYSPPPTCLVEAAEALARLVPPQARFATQDSLYYEQDSIGIGYSEKGKPRILFPGIERWLEWKCRCNGLSGLTIESASIPWVASEETILGIVNAQEWADRITRLAVTHVVAPSPAREKTLLDSGRFEVVWRCPPLSILEVRSAPDHPPPGSFLGGTPGVSAELEARNHEHLQIRFRSEQAQRATVALPWSPRWHTSIDGRPVPRERTGDGLLAVDLPAGSGVLGLDYTLDRWDRLGSVVTLATLAGMLLWAVRHRRTAAA